MQKSSSFASVWRVLNTFLFSQFLLVAGNAPVFALTAIPQQGWTLLSVDSEETSEFNGAGVNAFDGDISTFWHTQKQGSSPRPPHRIDIDLGAVHDVDGFRYLPRQDGVADGRVEIYMFYLSMDGLTWGRPVATGTFRNNAQEQEVTFALTQARFIRFEALTEENGQPWTSMAELNVLGAASSGVNVEPNGAIETPSDGVTIDVGGVLNFTASGSDPDSAAPLSYHWSFGDPTVADRTTKEPLGVTFNTPGTHTVTLTAIDHLGLADPTPATVQIIVDPTSLPRLIPQSSWSLLSVDSEKTTGEDGVATNAFDGDVNTYWHTQSQESDPTHPHRIEIDLGAVHVLNGFRYLPRQDGGVNGRVADYAFYVSMDGVDWGDAVATGTFQNYTEEQEVAFALTQGRYIRFEALSEVNGQPWTSVAELNVLRDVPDDPPINNADSTNQNVTVKANNAVLHVDFDSHPGGPYIKSDAMRDFNANESTEGITISRTDIVSDPTGDPARGKVMRVTHQANRGGVQGGFRFKARFPAADEYYMAFDIFIPNNYELVALEKLPGLMYGTLLEASHAAGVEPIPEGVKAFSVMHQLLGSEVWPRRGPAKLSSYVYDAERVKYDEFFDVINPANSPIETTWRLPKGQWVTIEQRIKQNTATSIEGVGDREDGILQQWVNGRLAVDKRKRFRTVNTMHIDGIYMYNFYGGAPSDPRNQPSQTQVEYFDNFIVSTSPITH